MPPDYFLNRIGQFHKKNGRAPRSSDFNGPFQKNVKKLFGSWEKAVDAELGLKLSHGRRSDDELIAEIKDFVAANNRIPNRTELKHDSVFIVRFGSYAKAIEAATGFNPETEILRALKLLTSATPLASLYEVASTVGLIGRPVTIHQIRGFMGHLARLGFVDVRRGDRIALYCLAAKGREELQAKGAHRVA
jgi:hypothetical protein